MPTYNAKCPECDEVQEYFCKMSERESALPDCTMCIDKKTGKPVKTEVAFTSNTAGGFILKGSGWFKKGGY